MRQYFENLRELKPEATGEVFRCTLKEHERKNLRAVVFDVYGTILVSGSGDINEFKHGKENILNALRMAGVECNGNIMDLEFGESVIREYLNEIRDTHRRKMKRGIAYPEVVIEDVWKSVLTRLRAKDEVKSFRETDFRKLSVIFEFLANPVYKMPGMESVISRLHGSGLRLGLVSNAQFYTPMVLKYFLGAADYLEEKAIPYFDDRFVHFSYQSGHAKPGPHMFRLMKEALETDGITPDQALFVGNDMLNDMLPAAKAGFRTVLFAGDKQSLRLRKFMAECKDLAPDVIITDLAQLLDVVPASVIPAKAAIPPAAE